MPAAPGLALEGELRLRSRDAGQDHTSIPIGHCEHYRIARFPHRRARYRLVSRPTDCPVTSTDTHFLAFSPSSTSRRMASERETSWDAAQASRVAKVAGSSRAGMVSL